jgi:hypothetical protein
MGCRGGGPGAAARADGPRTLPHCHPEKRRTEGSRSKPPAADRSRDRDPSLRSGRQKGHFSRNLFLESLPAVARGRGFSGPVPRGRRARRRPWRPFSVYYSPHEEADVENRGSAGSGPRSRPVDRGEGRHDARRAARSVAGPVALARSRDLRPPRAKGRGPPDRLRRGGARAGSLDDLARRPVARQRDEIEPGAFKVRSRDGSLLRPLAQDRGLTLPRVRAGEPPRATRLPGHGEPSPGEPRFENGGRGAKAG